MQANPSHSICNRYLQQCHAKYPFLAFNRKSGSIVNRYIPKVNRFASKTKIIRVELKQRVVFWQITRFYSKYRDTRAANNWDRKSFGGRSYIRIVTLNSRKNPFCSRYGLIWFCFFLFSFFKIFLKCIENRIECVCFLLGRGIFLLRGFVGWRFFFI